MARSSQDEFLGQTETNGKNSLEFDATGQTSIEVPSSDFTANAEMTRDGQDLVLEAPNGETVVVNNYFAADPAPIIESPDGSVLTENLVDSFLHSPAQYAQAGSMTDESPVGAIEEASGDATVIRADGTTEPITLGTPIYQGDVIETSADGAVNVVFIDETSMAVSENARLAVDEYQFDPSTESGETNLSILRGVFVFTSGLIGRDDPDDVQIDTPVGSIGIRGTIIAGNINPGGESEITVVEGAIVVKNGAMEKTLSQQFESIKLSGFDSEMHDLGVKSATDVSNTYGSVGNVVPKLFSSINDAAAEELAAKQAAEEVAKEEAEQKAADEAAAEEELVEETSEEEIQVEPEAEQPQEILLDATMDGESFGEPVAKTTDVNLDPVEKPRLEQRPNGQPKPSGGVKTFEVQYNNPDSSDDLSFTVIRHNVVEYAKEGTLIAKIVAQNLPAGTTFALDGANASLYTIAQTGSTVTITLSSAGQSALSVSPTLGTHLGDFAVKATLPGGHEIPWTFDTTIHDAALHIGPNASSSRINNIGVVTPTAPPTSIDTQLDGNTVVDTISLNGAGEIVITESGTPATETGANYEKILSLGDINNDGLEDIVAIADTSSLTDAGGVTVIKSGDATISHDTGSTSDQKGYAIANLGDFDGDGKSDYAFSSPGYTGDVGKVSVLNMSSGNMTIVGQTNERLGEYLSYVGDVNGDGLSDLLMSAGDTGGYILFGGNGGTSTANANLHNGNIGFKIYGLTDIVGAGAVGDINGDGFDDFAIANKVGSDVDTYVVFGKDTGFSAMSLTDLENPNNALKIHHAGASATDYNIISRGDINGDGFDDFQIGNAGGNQFVVRGSKEGNTSIVMDGGANDTAGTPGDPDGFIGANADGQSLVGNVDFFDNGHDNISMKGGGSNNNFNVSDNEFRNIDGGNGIDTITTAGNIDFSGIDFEQISQIERLDVTSGSVVTLTAENIFNMLRSSDNGELKISGTGTLHINDGTVTNSSTVHGALNEQGSGATQEADVLIGATTYEHYEIGGYDLYIDTSLTTTVA